MLDAEVLQRHGERQILHQIAVAHANEGYRAAGTLGQRHVAAEGEVGNRQTAFRRHLRLRDVARFDDLGAQQLLRLEHDVAVHQAADADDDDGRMGEDVAQPLVAARLGGQQQVAVFLVAAAEAESVGLQETLQAFQHLFRRQAGREFGLVRKGAQGVLARMLAVGLHVAQHARRVAVDAQAGGKHQEHQDQQEPGGVIDIVQPQHLEQLEPELAELHDVIGVGLVLLEHGADDRGDAEHRQQADGEAHRTHEFIQGAGGGFGRFFQDSKRFGGGNRHPRDNAIDCGSDYFRP